MPGRRHYSTPRWLTRRAREAAAGPALPVYATARPDRCRCRQILASKEADCINCKSARRPPDASQPMEAEPTREDARWSPAGFHRAAPEAEHVWQMPAPVRRLDKANRRLRRMLERHLSPGVMRGIATLVTTDAVLTTVCVLARALPHATRSAKVCLRRTQMSPVLDREAVVDSTLVVDSTRDTRIFTIGVDLSTLTWYIRQGALKRAHASTRRSREYCAKRAPSLPGTCCRDHPMLMKSPGFAQACRRPDARRAGSGLLHRCNPCSV